MKRSCIYVVNLHKVTGWVLALSLILGLAAPWAMATPLNADAPKLSHYTAKSGTIIAIEKGEQFTYLTVEDDTPGGLAVLVLGQYTVLLDDLELAEGAAVTAFILTNRPMTMQYPPHYYVSILEATPEEGIPFVKADIFDAELVSQDGWLKLNIGEDTVITDLQGEPFTGELGGKQLLVFYAVATRSIPALTTPERILVIDALVKEPREDEPEDAFPPAPAKLPYLGSFVGTISKVTKDTESTLLEVQSATAGFVHLKVNMVTFLLDGVKLEEGVEILAFFVHGPMTFIYPPQYNAFAICLAPENPAVIKGDTFAPSEVQQRLLSSDGMLTLTIGEHTQVLDIKGELYKGATIAGKPLLVYYSIATHSIPAQVTPTKIVVLELLTLTPTVDPAPPAEEVPLGERQSITMTIGSTVVGKGRLLLPEPPLAPQIVNGRTMLPFRYLVETVLDGGVTYDNLTGLVDARVGGYTFNMTLGQEDILIDGEAINFGQGPVNIDGTVLLPVRVFEILFEAIRWDAVNQVVTLIPKTP